MTREFTHLFLLKGEVPFYYFKHLYKKGVENYTHFVGTKEGSRIHLNKTVHRFEHTSLMANKLSFSLYMKHCGIPSPELVGHNLGKQFFYKDEHFQNNTKAELEAYFEKILNETKNQTLFLRPVASHGGKGCVRLTPENLKRAIAEHGDAILKESYVHNEWIEQHAKLNEIHPGCVNTLRLLTVVNLQGEVEVVVGFLRLGVGSSVVDNTAEGGIFVGFDLQNGRLYQKGYRAMEFGGEEVEEHPETHIRFSEFEVPFFKEACVLVVETAAAIPDMLIGWDVAITQDGPVIVEANEYPDLHGCDMIFNGLLRNAAFKRIADIANTERSSAAALFSGRLIHRKM